MNVEKRESIQLPAYTFEKGGFTYKERQLFYTAPRKYLNHDLMTIHLVGTVMLGDELVIGLFDGDTMASSTREVPSFFSHFQIGEQRFIANGMSPQQLIKDIEKISGQQVSKIRKIFPRFIYESS